MRQNGGCATPGAPAGIPAGAVVKLQGSTAKSQTAQWTGKDAGAPRALQRVCPSAKDFILEGPRCKIDPDESPAVLHPWVLTALLRHSPGLHRSGCDEHDAYRSHRLEL